MNRNYRTSGARLYLPANSTQADFTTVTPVLANGVRVDHSVQSGELYVNYTNTVNWKVVAPGLYRGARIEFFGAGNDNTTFDYRIWGVFPRFAGTTNLNMYQYADILSLGIINLGTGSCTLSTLLGTGTPVPASNRYVDTLTFTLSDGTTTPTGVGDVFSTAYNLGTPTAYSPANNSQAVLAFPDINNVFGFIIEFDMTGATSANALIEFTV